MHLASEHFFKNDNKFSIVVQNFNTPLSATDRIIHQKNQKRERISENNRPTGPKLHI